MRRPSTDATSIWSIYEALDAVPTYKLELIGAICLVWNFIEDAIDETVGWTMGLNAEMQREVVSRISGIDGKFEIIKKAARSNPVFDDDVATEICNAIGAVAEFKRYRDAVIHARLTDPTLDVAPTITKKGRPYEVLISSEALEALYDGLTALSREIAFAHWLFANCAIAEDNLAPPLDHGKLRASEEFQADLARFREHQSHRLSLPPLPKFPDEHATPPERGVLQEPPEESPP